MSAGNHIAVITLADRPTIRLDYSNDMAALSKSVGSIFAQPMSGMTLLDAVIETSKGFERRETPRAIMVAVFTDGREFTNTYSKDAIEALEPRQGGHARGHDRTVPAHRGALDAGTVAVPRRRPDPVGRPAHHDAESERPRACARHGWPRSCLSQYKVVYARPESLIQPGKVRVSAGRPNLVVHGAPSRGENGV